MRLLLALLLCLSAFAAVADQMYRWVDSEGHVHYSQTPPPGTNLKPETVQIQTPQHYSTDVPAADQPQKGPPDDSEAAAQARADAHKAEVEARKKALHDQQCASLREQRTLYLQAEASQKTPDAARDKALQDLNDQIASQCTDQP